MPPVSPMRDGGGGGGGNSRAQTLSRRERRRMKRRPAVSATEKQDEVEELPALKFDDEWQEGAKKQPLILVVNLDGSINIAVDTVREKELHAVEEPPERNPTPEELAQEGRLWYVVHCGRMRIRPFQLALVMVLLALLGLTSSMMYVFLGSTGAGSGPSATAVKQCSRNHNCESLSTGAVDLAGDGRRLRGEGGVRGPLRRAMLGADAARR